MKTKSPCIHRSVLKFLSVKSYSFKHMSNTFKFMLKIDILLLTLSTHCLSILSSIHSTPSTLDPSVPQAGLYLVFHLSTLETAGELGEATVVQPRSEHRHSNYHHISTVIFLYRDITRSIGTHTIATVLRQIPHICPQIRYYVQKCEEYRFFHSQSF